MALDTTIVVFGLVVFLLVAAIAIVGCFACCWAAVAVSTQPPDRDMDLQGLEPSSKIRDIDTRQLPARGAWSGSPGRRTVRQSLPEVSTSAEARAIAVVPRQAQTQVPTVSMGADVFATIYTASSGPVPKPKPISKKAAQPLADFHVLTAGYAHQLVFLFGDTLAVHCASVSSIVNAFGFDGADICFSAICLEQAAKGAMKSAGKGIQNARVWIVALARFVLYAQGLHNAIREEHLRIPCETWGYNVADFMKKVSPAEAAFQKQHGLAMLWAFQQEAVRLAEVSRINSCLQALGSASGAVASLPATRSSSSASSKRPALTQGQVSGKRLALSDSNSEVQAAPRKRQRGGRSGQ